MIKLICILFITVILFSCSDKEVKPIKDYSMVQEKPEIIEPPLVLFTNIIPEELSDSAKTEIIKVITEGIDSDTTLNRQVIIDSTMTFMAYYRNDTLVKLVEDRSFKYVKSGGAYYFCMGELICAKEYCSSFFQTGSCNPTHSIGFSFFIRNRIIHQEYDTKIGYYKSCGCYDYSKFKRDLEEYEKMILDRSNQLKTKFLLNEL